MPVPVVARRYPDAVAVHSGGGGRDRLSDLGVAHAALRAAELPAQQLRQDGRRHTPLDQLAEEPAVLGHRAQQLEQRLACQRRLRPGHLHLGGLDPRGQEEVLELALGHEVLLDLALLHLEERRLRDEEVARLDDLVHVAEEEGQEQRADVGAVHVRVGHQDDLVIAELREVELLGADPRPHRRDEQTDLVVGEHLVVTRLLRVDDLAPQRQHRLGPAVAALLGRAAGRVALDQEELAGPRLALRAVGELRREPFVVAPALAGELARLPRRLARLRRPHALVGDLPRGRRILLEGLGQLVVDDLLDEPLDVRVAELGLGLALELRLGQPDGDDGRQPLAHVVAGDASLEALEEAVRLGVGGDPARHGRAEPGEVRAALARVDVVREGEHRLLVAVVVLQGDLDLDVPLLALEVEDLRVDRRLVLVQVLDELDDAALVEERVGASVALVLDDDLEAAVQERELAEAVRQGVEGEGRLLEDRRVRLEADDRAVLRGLLARGQRAGRPAALLVALGPHLAAPPDLDLEPLAQRVHDRDADAVETARDLVGGMLELPAGVQDRQDDLRGRLPALLVEVHGDAAPVVTDRTGSVRVEDDLDGVAVRPERLVHGVIHRLVHEVVEPVGARVADVHRGALADGLEALEDLDVARGVGFVAHTGAMPPALTWKTAAPSTASVSGDVRNTCSAAPSSRSTSSRTPGSSSESASSSSSTGAVPAASATGSTSASRRTSATSRCCPREAKARASTSSISIARSSR